MNRKHIWFAMIGASIILIVAMMIPKTGPSDELIHQDFSAEMLKMSGGVLDVDVDVINRNVIAKDLIDIEVKLTLQRTNQKVPPELMARALMSKKITGKDFMLKGLQAGPGFRFPPEMKTIRYKRVGDHWQKIS